MVHSSKKLRSSCNKTKTKMRVADRMPLQLEVVSKSYVSLALKKRHQQLVESKSSSPRRLEVSK
jgi:hypothetical protein